MRSEFVDTVVVGGGQAGLAIGHFLSGGHPEHRGHGVVILDAQARVGESWRRRWDSLRLFTPASFDALPGLRFPAPHRYFPTKDEMAAYLEDYAAHFQLPVRLGRQVVRLAREDRRYVVTLADEVIEANHVILATGPYRIPRIPDFARALDPAIRQIHSAEYRNPSQLLPGSALVVGAGNSGAEIALELAGAGHATMLAGRDTGHIPITLGPLGYRILGHLPIGVWPGSALAKKLAGGGHPLVRVGPKDLARAGVARTPRVDSARDGRPVLAGGRAVDAANVLWCTGFRPDYSWIDLPAFAGGATPAHERGVVVDEPSLYFVGLPLQSSLTSGLVGGVGRDARTISRALARRRTTSTQ